MVIFDIIPFVFQKIDVFPFVFQKIIFDVNIYLFLALIFLTLVPYIKF